jgi:hypothetical protein
MAVAAAQQSYFIIDNDGGNVMADVNTRFWHDKKW